jgi:hypothetical protein
VKVASRDAPADGSAASIAQMVLAEELGPVATFK